MADEGEMTRNRVAGLSGLGLALAVIVFAVVSSRGAGTSKASASPPVVRISERDFRIRAPRRVAAGLVALRVANHGPDTHELIVVHSHGAPLRLRSDGVTVDEDALRAVKVGSVEGAMPGAVHTLRVRLTRGRYVMFCNMSGHYLGGMHAELVVL